MMQQSQTNTHQGHLGHHFVDATHKQPYALPPHLSTAPRHHSMPDRRPMDEGASGLMQAAHELMLGAEGVAWPRMPAVRSITLPTDHWNVRPSPWDAPSPHMPEPRRLPYHASAAHPSMNHRMQQYTPGRQLHSQPEYAVVRSPPSAVRSPPPPVSRSPPQATLKLSARHVLDPHLGANFSGHPV